MTVMCQPQAIQAGSEVQDQLHVGREDIVFYNVRKDLVRIEITVSNLGLQSSRPTPLRLQAAPLGAFLRWTDLTTLSVPRLESGETVTLAAEVSCPRPQPLGRFDRVPPDRLLTALGMFDDQRRETSAAGQPESATGMVRRGMTRRSVGPTSILPQLPPDPMDLFGHSNPHWAGNVNVLVGKSAVERHVARALRIYPGRDNLAALIVGNGGRDAYSFELRGEGAAWDARLTSTCHSRQRRRAAGFHELAPGPWHAVDGMLVVLLQVRPPTACEFGELAVHVSRRSTGETAIVEFSLDASAQGPGCYAV